MRRFLRDNGLTLFFLVLMAATLVAQMVSGLAEFNDQQLAQAGQPVSFLDYVTSSDFAVDVAENWQSEYLQFFLYIFVTVWFIQRGSPESKPPGDAGGETDEQQRTGPYARDDSPAWVRAGGLRAVVFSRSLGMVMGLFFLLSWLAQSVAGRAAYNAQQFAQYEDGVSWAGYVTSADFWNRTLQNWQSEFLAIASMAALSIYLRQRGSPESKPVGSSHAATGVEG